MQNSFAPPPSYHGLIATRVPHFHFVADPTQSADAANGDDGAGSAGRRLRREVMRDFVGMEAVDEATRHALVDFSYFLTVGNLDEAHRAVKLVRSAAVWENMAKVCERREPTRIAVAAPGCWLRAATSTWLVLDA